ncbi:MAG: tetratricopeptide repeat protein [Bryobacteraceae bacterium]|nr:tetratricopeptide repeat protein [Bryobacteraceae bacterium]
MPSLAADPQLSEGFEHFYNLEYPQAITFFRAATVREPEKPERWNHLAQALLYSEMFKAGALESELVSGSNPFVRREKMQPSAEVAKQFDECVAKALQLGNDRIAKNPRDRDALYALGIAYGLRANYNYLVRKAWMDSLRDSSSARKAHARIAEFYPDDVDCRLIEGVYSYIVGSLPWHIKTLGFLAGYRGDREGGLKTLRLVADKGLQNRYDARVILSALYRRERRPTEALPLLQSVSERFPRNYLFRLEMVQMYSDAGNKDAAIAILARLEAEKVANTPALANVPVEKIWYYRGNLLFWYRDYETAIQHLRKATPNAPALDLHTAVMTWLRLGQCYDLTQDRKSAQSAYREAMKLGPDTDAAKESKNYLNSPYKRPADV